MNYLLHILIMINIYIILAISANLIVGLANLLSLGQAAFYGIGAYITALALMKFGIPLFASLILALLVTAFIGFIIGIIALRLKDDYFILATLGFQIIIYTVLYNWVSITNGPFGISGIPAPKLFSLFPVIGLFAFFILSTVLSLGVILIFRNLIHSPFGRALKAMRDNNIALLALGRNTAMLKTQAFTISSGFSGISGFLFATYITYIDPTSFNLDESLFIISAILIGGTGNIRGPIIGAIFVVAIPELLRFIGMPGNIAANMRMIIYGLILVTLMMFRRQGLAGDYKH